MPIDNVSFSTDEDVPVSTETPSSGATDGEGGDDLALWSMGDEERYSKLSQIPAENWENNSQYDVFTGGGIYNPSYSQFSTRETGETGYNINAEVLDENSDPILGNGVLLNADGEVIVGRQVSGKFSLSAPPAQGVVYGGNDNSKQAYNLYFTPNTDGVPVSEEGVNSEETYTFTYRSVLFSVMDSDGNKLQGYPVVPESGDTYRTGDNGEVSIILPGGSEVEITALGGAVTRSIDPDSTSSVDFQFAGVNVNIRGPDGEPLTGMPVVLDITGDRMETGPDGMVSFKTVPPVSGGSVLALDSVERSVGQLTEGFTDTIEISLGVKLEGVIRDSSGDRVEKSSVVIRDPEGKEYAGSNKSGGSYTAATTQTGQLLLVVAEGDRRYEKAEFYFTIGSSQTVKSDIELSEKENVGTM